MTEPRIYRASSLGYSLCSLVCGHLGFEPASPPDYLQAIFDEGHRLESVVIDKLLENGWKIWAYQDEVNALGDYQHEVELEVIPGVAKVVGHLDGKCVPREFMPKHILEVKTMSHKSFVDWEMHGWGSNSPLIEKYKWQASAYMLATGLPHAMVGWDKEKETWLAIYTQEPFYTISDIALKLASAEECIRTNTIPDGCTDFPCPYFFLHENKDDIPEEQADEQMNSLMEAWLKAQSRAKIYDGEAKALRDMLVEMAGEKIAGRVRGSQGVTVTTTWVEEKVVNYKVKPHWETRVSAPRKAKNVAE